MSENRYIVIANPDVIYMDGHFPDISNIYCDMYYIPEDKFNEQQLNILKQTEGMAFKELKNNTDITDSILDGEPTVDFDKYCNKIPAKPFTIVSCHYFFS